MTILSVIADQHNIRYLIEEVLHSEQFIPERKTEPNGEIVAHRLRWLGKTSLHITIKRTDEQVIRLSIDASTTGTQLVRDDSQNLETRVLHKIVHRIAEAQVN